MKTSNNKVCLPKRSHLWTCTQMKILPKQFFVLTVGTRINIWLTVLSRTLVDWKSLVKWSQPYVPCHCNIFTSGTKNGFDMKSLNQLLFQIVGLWRWWCNFWLILPIKNFFSPSKYEGSHTTLANSILRLFIFWRKVLVMVVVDWVRNSY